MGVSELGAPWGSLVVLLQRLAATLATSSNHNSLELALIAVRNHVNDAILHAQLHGPRITATVSKWDDDWFTLLCINVLKRYILKRNLERERKKKTLKRPKLNEDQQQIMKHNHLLPNNKVI